MTPAGPAAEDGWGGLVTAALLGTARRPVDVSTLPGPVAARLATVPAGAEPDDPAVRLLSAAALATVYRRAGARPVPAPPPLPAAPEDEAAPVGRAAAARLAGLLDGDRADLLAEWLRAAAAAGRRVPAELLPAVLDAAVRTRALVPDVAAVLGRRGAWLAALRADWSRVLATAVAPADAAPDGRDWTHGDATARRRYLAAARRRDPRAATALLDASWSTETGPDRLALLAVLDAELSEADGPLLERALDDRRRDVRDTAALLLSRLPGSAFAARMTARAGGCVGVRHRLRRPRVEVTPPAGCDEAMRRDGIRAAPPGAGVGERAFWLRQVVAATPLSAWPALLAAGSGTAPDAAAVVAMPVDGDWAEVLRSGWVDAAVRQRNAAWALALLPVAAHDHVRLLDVVPEVARAGAVARLLDDLRLTVCSADPAAAALLATCPAPWPAALADTVLAQLARPSGDPAHHRVRENLRLAALRLPAHRATEVLRLGRAHRAGSPWQRALGALADTLTIRHQMLEEIR